MMATIPNNNVLVVILMNDSASTISQCLRSVIEGHPRGIRSHTATAQLICADWTARYEVFNSYGGFSRNLPNVGGNLPPCNLAHD